MFSAFAIFAQKQNNSMKLTELIKKYREAAGLTQNLLAAEICYNTRGEIKPTVGVINGLERSRPESDDKLKCYLQQRFYNLDTKKNSRIVSLSYHIAESCVENGVELDYKRLFFCITLDDVLTYLNEIYELNEEEKETLSCMPETVDFQYDIELGIVTDDLSIFVFNLCLWYFLLSNKYEPNISKDEYSSEQFVKNATLFGFPEFSTTSEKARGKIARTIVTRISILDHFVDLNERLDFASYYSPDLQKQYLKLCSEAKNISLDEKALFFDDIDSITRIVKREATELSEDDVAFIIRNVCNIQSNLLIIYALFQGFPLIPSKRYVEDLKRKFENQHLYELNPELKEKVETLVENFNEMMENDLGKLSDFESLLKIGGIQFALSSLYKSYYVLKSHLNKVDNILLEIKQ